MIKDIELSLPHARAFCWKCRQPQSGCFCERVVPFDPQIEFAVLIHKIEVRRRIASGRMSHLILKRSHLIEGDQFDGHPVVEGLIARPDVHAVVLYPGKGSVDLSQSSATELTQLTPAGKRLLVFVIDGTWATARRTMRLSLNLQRLPRICFSPSRASQFKVRKQPAEHCLSTLEAIHETIELLGNTQGFEVAARTHDHLLDVFASMVDRQLAYVPAGHLKQVPDHVPTFIREVPQA